MIGTAIGLGDWSQDNVAMDPSYSGRPQGFSTLERNAIRMMYQHRNAGNVLPDRAPGFTGAGGSHAVEVEQELGRQRRSPPLCPLSSLSRTTV